jgi:hypothetical protein
MGAIAYLAVRDINKAKLRRAGAATTAGAPGSGGGLERRTEPVDHLDRA